MSEVPHMPVDCPEHGATEARFACSHLIDVLDGGPKVVDVVFSDDGRTAACPPCDTKTQDDEQRFEQLPERLGITEMNEEAMQTIEESAEVQVLTSGSPLTLLCSLCFERMLELNGLNT